jgi:hypothetical protein
VKEPRFAEIVFGQHVAADQAVAGTHELKLAGARLVCLRDCCCRPDRTRTEVAFCPPVAIISGA